MGIENWKTYDNCQNGREDDQDADHALEWVDFAEKGLVERGGSLNFKIEPDVQPIRDACCEGM